MFKSISELVTLSCKKEKKIYEIMIEQEIFQTGVTKKEIIGRMLQNLTVMKEAIKKGVEGVHSLSGMTGGDAKKIFKYIKVGGKLIDETHLKAICYSIATNEVNAAMGVICATPTAGSAGVLPGVLLALQEKLKASDDDVIKGLFTAGAIGYVIANNAVISGASGGCQAEIGSASAMAAAAAVEMAGGNQVQAANAMAIALKNMLGLVCDPVAGLVEIPCIKRNAAGASIALMAAEMALAGVESKIPWDEVIYAMRQVGNSIPSSLRETALGGLADTETGRQWKQLLKENRQGQKIL